ncbi:MAG: hypothetical protein LBI18_00215 [Planctomycetaceae bacterium]|nr:hypothetical protein [Planctomycetaceae bacterium]
MTSDTGTSSGYGYLEYRFRVTNNDTKSHTVRLEIPKDNYMYGTTALSRLSNSVMVPPQSAVILRLLQPPFPMGFPVGGSYEAQVIIDGRSQDDSVLFRKINNHGRFYYSHSHDIANILTSKDVGGDLRNLFQNGVSPEKTENSEQETENQENETVTIPPSTIVVPAASGSHTPPAELMSWTSNIPVEEWSDYWLAYTRFDAVILTDSEWNEIQEQHAGIFEALKKYTETGGILGVVGTNGNIPKEWLPVEDAAQTSTQNSAQNSAQQYQAILGLVYIFDKNTETAKPAIEPFRETVLLHVKLWRNTYGSVNSSAHSNRGVRYPNETTLLSSLPVVADYSINIKLIMVLIIVFAILIGPVNIYVLSLFKHRIWLLWTVPLTSLVAGVLVFGVSLFQEGFLRQSSSATYTILDQQHEEAITFGFVGFYSTLTPRGIIFAPETEATACLDRGYGNTRLLEISILAGGHQFLTRGWISARIPAYFMIRKAQSQRKERLTFDWATDSSSVANGLGVDIKELKVCSPTGNLLTAHNIKAGEKVPLTLSNSKETINASLIFSKAATFNELRRTYESIIQNGNANKQFIGSFFPSDRLPAGSYLAEIEVWNPFVEEGIERTTPYQNKTIIFGLFE